MEARWLQNPAQDHPGSLMEAVQKIHEKMTQNGAQKGAKMEARWESKSMKKCVQKQGRLQEGSQGAPGSLLEPCWEPFLSIFGCVFVFSHVFFYDFHVKISVSRVFVQFCLCDFE